MTISLRKVCVNNLKSIDLDLPYNKLIALCGLSGSGKSSLAIDTLYAEGQRRYIETFSACTRQFLEKLERPDAERIDGIPPAIAVTSRPSSQMSRSTVGTATETSDYLRLLFSEVGNVFCQSCGREVRRDTPDSILKSFQRIQDGTKVLIAFSPSDESLRSNKKDVFESEWKDRGFLRGIVFDKMFRLDDGGIPLQAFGNARLLALADNPPTDEEIREEAGQQDMDENETCSSNDATDDDLNDFEFMEEDAPSLEKTQERLDAFDSETEIFGSECDETSSEDEFEKELEAKMSSRLLKIDVGGKMFLEDINRRRNEMLKPGGVPQLFFIVDRVTIGKTTQERIRESLETALAYGDSQCWIFIEGDFHPKSLEKTMQKTENASQNSDATSQKNEEQPHETCSCHLCQKSFHDACLEPTEQEKSVEPVESAELSEPAESPESATRIGRPYAIDGQDWTLLGFSRKHRCEDCGIEYPDLEPKLFSFNSPLGACSLCEGFGNLMVLDLDLIVPNKSRTIRNGAIAPWNSSSYRYKLEELVNLSDQLGVRVDIPFSKLTPKEIDLVLNGSKRLNYDGLNGFFIRLQKQKYKMHIRVFLSRWRSYRVCPLCHGSRLRPESLAVQIGHHDIHQLSMMRISQFLDVINHWSLTPWQQQVGRTALTQIKNRLKYLEQVGLGYLTLERPMKSLSEGEQRRVSLTSVLGSSLVDMLYVLDEPSIGLHPQDTQQLLQSILELRDRGNSVVVVEHEETILNHADRILEIGPEAGQNGGQIIFEGTVDEIKASEKSLTGSYLAGRRGAGTTNRRRILEHGFIELTGTTGNNLKNLHAIFPLGVLCVVTGVSGAGKSSLVQETLYPALSKSLGREISGLPYDKILGVEQIDDVVLVDQTPIGRSPRSNPVTYLKIFDDIRALFAETPEAKANLYNAGYFSFNVDGGRCNTCKGEGFIAIDMQFMADMFVKCPQCNGKRYQREILDIVFRGKNIAEVLDLTVREAFSFFRGQSRIQQKLKRLMDVGLDYVRLGQPANTLSGGESQRLKLAAYLSNVKKGNCLFILDEPTTGLHFADVVQLLDDFDALIDSGHSLIVVEHNLQMIRAADYIIDLGPGAAEKGGQIVAEGTPEQVARCENSATGRFLANLLKC